MDMLPAGGWRAATSDNVNPACQEAAMQRRNWTTEQKIAIALEGLRGETKVADLCRKHQIKETTYYRWRDIFLEGGKNALANGQSRPDELLQAKVADYERLLGQKVAELEVLKKTANLGL